MNNFKILILSGLLGAACVMPAPAAATTPEAVGTRFSPQAQGYLRRAADMRAAGNYAGVIDQLRHINTQQPPLTAPQAEQYTFLLADAYYQRGSEECLGLLIAFATQYPASPLAPEASLAIGDYYFFRHDWPDALEAYNAVDFSRLNRDNQLLYSYRKALAMIKTGHFREARPLLSKLRGHADYADAYWFYTAYLDYIDGKFKDAYSAFQRVTPSVPGLNAGYYMTQIEYTWGQYADVISHGRSLLHKQHVAELAPELQRIVGLSYFKTGEPDVAYGFLTNYLADTPGTPADDALYALGAIDYLHGDYALAMQRLEPLTSLNSAIGQGALLYMGQCYLKDDNPTSAAMAFEKASRMGYDSAVAETALYNYVTALTQGGKVPFSSSSKMLEQFVASYPQSEYTPEVEAYLATAYYNDRNYSKALQYIDAIRRPDSSQLALRQKILYELGVEAVTNGRQDAAVDYLRQAASMTKQDAALAAQSSLWLGDALFSLGRYAEARSAYESFVGSSAVTAASENRALGYYNLAYSKYKLKDYAGAAANFATALSARPALSATLRDDALIRRGDCLYYIGRYQEAASQFGAAIDNDALDSDYALYRRAQLRGVAGDSKGKLADLARIEKDYPNSRWLSKSLLEQALAYEEAGRSDLAADAYKKRLAVTEDVDIDELLRMAAAMHSAGRSADLLEVTERIRHAGGLEADEAAELSLHEAHALADLGRGSEAEAIYAELAKTPTSLPGSEAAVALAEAALAKGDAARARDLMEEFTETGTPHQYWLARGFITLADAYNALGEKSLAREYLSSLRENYPGADDDIISRIKQRKY